MTDFLILFVFNTLKSATLSSRIELVLSPTLYKFIVWACWAKTQSYTGSNPNSVLTIGTICGKNLIYSESVSSATFKMEEASPHQVAAGSHQLDANHTK